MGWVQFPATSNEQARSGPGIRTQLMHIYNKYLEEFDQKYVQSVIDRRHKTAQNPAASLSNPNAPIMPSNGPNSQILTPEAVAAENQLRGKLQLARLANKSAAEMRSMNLPEQLIATVEANRQILLPIHTAISNAPPSEHLNIARQISTQPLSVAPRLPTSIGVQSSAKPLSDQEAAARQTMLKFRNEQIPKRKASAAG